MKLLKTLNKILALSVFFFLNSAFAHDTSTTPIQCNQQYALCASAACIPDPNNLDRAICSCNVQNGNNIGYSSCKKRMPTQDKYQVTHILSTFSFHDAYNKKGMKCKQAPWTNCLDKPCTLDPLNHNHAICSCPIVAPSDFVTFGGNCDANTCNTGFWSGNTLSDANTLRTLLSQSDKDKALPENDTCTPNE